MSFINISNIKSIEDTCGSLKELYNSENISLSLATITHDATPHKHHETEEVYYILNGQAEIDLDGQQRSVKTGDIVPIPKDTYHHICNIQQPIRVIVVTHPRFNPQDVIK